MQKLPSLACCSRVLLTLEMPQSCMIGDPAELHEWEAMSIGYKQNYCTNTTGKSAIHSSIQMDNRVSRAATSCNGQLDQSKSWCLRALRPYRRLYHNFKVQARGMETRTSTKSSIYSPRPVSDLEWHTLAVKEFLQSSALQLYCFPGIVTQVSQKEVKRWGWWKASEAQISRNWPGKIVFGESCMSKTVLETFSTWFCDFPLRRWIGDSKILWWGLYRSCLCASAGTSANGKRF